MILVGLKFVIWHSLLNLRTSCSSSFTFIRMHSYITLLLNTYLSIPCFAIECEKICMIHKHVKVFSLVLLFLLLLCDLKYKLCARHAWMVIREFKCFYLWTVCDQTSFFGNFFLFAWMNDRYKINPMCHWMIFYRSHSCVSHACIDNHL